MARSTARGLPCFFESTLWKLDPREMTSVPSISLIIPTRNRADELSKCLGLLMAQLPSDGSMNVQVCDDSDGRETADLLAREFPNVKLHPGTRSGPGANRNLGAREATGDWLIFLDDDCLPRPGLIASYLAEIRGSGLRVDRVLSGPVVRNDSRKDSLLWEAPHNPVEHELPPSCNFALPRKVFLEAGGFDERFRFSFEDMEFFARLHILKVPFLFLPEAVVDHPSRLIPRPSKLALRWESRVISSFDFGANLPQVLWLLPKHILLVILSRFRGKKLSVENLRAAGVFLVEFGITITLLPSWLRKYHAAPRSAFWIEQVKKGTTPRRFGL